VNVQDPLTEVDDRAFVLAGVVPVPRVDKHAHRVTARLRKGGAVAEMPQELVLAFAPTMQRPDDLQRQPYPVLGQDLHACPQPTPQGAANLTGGDVA
jgi:hypothetical protein